MIATPLCIAIVQQPMAWTTPENLVHIVTALALAAEQGAGIAVFPELALTGFHRGIRAEAVPATVDAALQQVRAACRAHGIACALGAPTFAADGAILNSYLHIDTAGEVISSVSKNGLTPAELTFFAAGNGRPVMRFEGRTCTTVMCREIDDLESVAVQLQSDPVDLVFWPSMVGNPPGTIHSTPEQTADLGYFKRTAVLARRLGAFVVQSNWPQALNTPESTYLGESKVYARDGEILLTLPRDQPGVGVFTLGERDFRWTPLVV
ncbi:MAG: nitrilase-related carbon-nitrogen hydrolase [Burkholderiales bacterium]|nr:nitrilase-related carbon-nitrogen hydrolase [Burkholderiales bacterium]